MKNPTRIALLGGCIAGALLLVLPSIGVAFSTITGSLGIATTGQGYQRDVRVFNNAADTQTNDNVTADPAFPGSTGAVKSIWKASYNWSSEDTKSGKNFDFDFQGTAASAGSSTQNTVSFSNSDPNCSGGTLAYTNVGATTSDGWNIVTCDSGITWSDNDTAPPGGQMDLQGVTTHELGHALGLGHSTVNCGTCNDGASGHSTMCAFICTTGFVERTPASDDKAGLESKYGVKAGTKPRITGLSGSFSQGGVLTITGTNFAASVNVKFTAGTTTNTGAIPGVVTGVASSGGGTTVNVTIPATAQDGNVLIWQPTGAMLSNAFPIDIGSVVLPPTLTLVNPNSVQAIGETITLTGTNFTTATAVTVGANVVSAGDFDVVNSTTITLLTPQPTTLGQVNVSVTNPGGTTGTLPLTYVATSPPTMDAPFIVLNNASGTWSWGGPANHNFFFVANFDSSQITYHSTMLLNPVVFVALGSSGAAGVGSVTLPISGVPVGGITVWCQGWFNPPATANIIATNIDGTLMF